jgi:DNA processing protein
LPYLWGENTLADSRWLQFLQSELLNHSQRCQLLARGFDPAQPDSFESIENTQVSPPREAMASPLDPFAQLKQELQSPTQAPAITSSRPVSLTGFGQPDYPRLLAELPDAPPALFGVGNIKALSLPGIAIVGTRRPSLAGIEIARELAGQLAEAGFCVVSGLARGIDTAAHRGALDAGGATIAVMATGCDRIYPAENNKLAHEMGGQGLLVSEFCPGAQPHRWHFPRRNRTLSGLALATVVVEAGRPSGTLITAAAAGEQGREVFAFPWSVRHKGGAGCLYLLQQGATLATSASDILTHLSQILHGWFDLAPSKTHSEGQPSVTTSNSKCGAALSEEGLLSDNARDLLVAMGDGGFDIASLCQVQGVDMPAMLTLMTQLELGGYVQQTAQGLWHVRAGSKC